MTAAQILKISGIIDSHEQQAFLGSILQIPL